MPEISSRNCPEAKACWLRCSNVSVLGPLVDKDGSRTRTEQGHGWDVDGVRTRMGEDLDGARA